MRDNKAYKSGVGVSRFDMACVDAIEEDDGEDNSIEDDDDDQESDQDSDSRDPLEDDGKDKDLDDLFQESLADLKSKSRSMLLQSAWGEDFGDSDTDEGIDDIDRLLKNYQYTKNQGC